MSESSAAVVGPGGVGGLLGALLVRAGWRVEFIAGDATVAALRAEGLRVRSAQYGEFAVPVEAVTELTGPVDVCFLATKATSLTGALARVPAWTLGEGLVVPLLNGVEHMAALRARYPAEQVVAGAVRVESTRVAPGRIEHTSPFLTIELAGADASRARVEGLADALRQAGVETSVRGDETVMLWHKLTFLAAIALLTTRHAATVGEIRSEWRDDLLRVIGEITMVAEAEGAALDPDEIVAFVDGLPYGMKSSMQRDAEAARPTELDALGGAVLRAAGRHGIKVPCLTALVGDLEAGRGGPHAPGA